MAAAAVDISTAIDSFDTGELDALSENICLNDIVSLSSNGALMEEPGNAGEILTRVELDVAYCSEKLLNLDILLMQVSSRESGCEPLDIVNISDESAEVALEFDLLSGILDSELRELNSFMTYLQTEIADAHHKNSSREHFKEAFVETEDKLHDSEETLKQSRNQLEVMKMQFATFQRTLSTFSGQGNIKDEDSQGNGQFQHLDTQLKMQTVEQQKHILRMLEKSLARELDMEKKLSDSRNSEEDLKKKLYSAEHELCWMEEETEVVYERLFEAENAAKSLMGISKSLLGRMHTLQFNLNGSTQREDEMRSKLENSMEEVRTKERSLLELEHRNLELENALNDTLKKADDKYMLANLEASSLREKMDSLEEQLKQSQSELVLANSEASSLREKINSLDEQLKQSQSELQIVKASMEQTQEQQALQSSLLEKKLRESEIQLQHAKASAEASQEHQDMLDSTIEDMADVIEDLKSRVSKAENRAEKAEAKCVVLSETNIEITEEMSFIRSRMECLEISLNQSDDQKIVTAKDLSIRTTAISDLVLRLAKERERLQNQISSLIKENKVLAANLDKEDPAVAIEHISEGDPSTGAKASEEGVAESSISSFQVDQLSKAATVFKTEVKAAVFREEEVITGTGTSSVESVRSIDAWQLNSKYYLVPLLILFISITVYLFQLKQCPF